MKQKTIINRIEQIGDGHLFIRFALLEFDDAGKEIGCKWHRTSLAPGGDVDAQLATVNDHLVQMGKEKIDDAAGVAELKKKAASVKPAAIKAYREKVRKGHP